MRCGKGALFLAQSASCYEGTNHRARNSSAGLLPYPGAGQGLTVQHPARGRPRRPVRPSHRCCYSMSLSAQSHKQFSVKGGVLASSQARTPQLVVGNLGRPRHHQHAAFRACCSQQQAICAETAVAGRQDSCITHRSDHRSGSTAPTVCLQKTAGERRGKRSLGQPPREGVDAEKPIQRAGIIAPGRGQPRQGVNRSGSKNSTRTAWAGKGPSTAARTSARMC